ncbi:MAG: type II secretion system protein GspG [Planctomycetota bacterium]|nr:type II secretion system protein GspG [Planctomycetota bacterium]
MSVIYRNPLAVVIVLLSLAVMAPCKGDDPLPPGLTEAIRNPLIPVIVDATVLRYDKQGYGEIKINTVFSSGPSKKQGETPAVELPRVIRGYSIDGKTKIAPLKVVLSGNTGRFLLFLDGDLLFSTYNHHFPIREMKPGKVEVGVGFNGGGAPWKPLWEMLCLIRNYPDHQKTEKDFRSAIQKFYVTTGRFPTTQEGLVALFHCPPAMKKETWGGPFVSGERSLWADSFFYKREPSGKYSLDSKIRILKGK